MRRVNKSNSKQPATPAGRRTFARSLTDARPPTVSLTRMRGVTIIELMIALVILAILLVIAVPSFNDFVRTMRLNSSMTDLRSDLQLARSESIRRNSRVLLCPRSTATSTTCATAVTATTWMNGWLVCHDTDADGACDAGTTSDPNPVRVRSAPGLPLSLTGPTASVTFFPVGNANGAAIFTVTATGTSSSRSTTVAPSGSLTSSKT